MTEVSKIIFRDDNGVILAELIISKLSNTNIYEIRDIISCKVHKVPYVIYNTLLIYIKHLKNFTNLNIEIIERDGK